MNEGYRYSVLDMTAQKRQMFRTKLHFHKKKGLMTICFVGLPELQWVQEYVHEYGYSCIPS